MSYTDRHVHTRFSPDSDADVAAYIARAKELGQKYLIFTDHVDFGGFDPEFAEPIDYDEYKEYMRELEEKHQFPIRIGVEIGYEKSHKKEIDEFLGKYEFDFVIASIHHGNDGDFYYGDFFIGKDKYQAYLAYFQLVLEMVENFTSYDVVGHIDYISRYGPYEEKHYNYEDYMDIIDRILKAIIRNKKGIEVNTSGLRGPLNIAFPKDELLLRYKELGGTNITVGSDCHFIEDYMADVEETIKKLEAMGFTIK